MVASWSEDTVDTIDLLIEPRRGLTQHLLRCNRTPQHLCPALFTGPHGNSIPVGDYEVVLMVASGYGIAAQLPYLKQLLHNYNRRSVRSRRIHLVWELKTLDLANAIEILLNNALDEDTLDNGYILQISVYVEQVQIGQRISRRAEVIKGLPDWHSIIEEEVKGKLIKRVQEESPTIDSMIVTVSASASVRQDLRANVKRHVGDGVSLVELDYQPS
ncbi:hypothetical protein NLG97_g4307 [Lecanicillium saksenae]|uniref:Uncharacterized protein n=1 Tax=Lecanicillium saksenae TaxID=468837 RepID=A0ACC1QWV1_9HYPO|nr:hypothetical protein NLG97_g4307 [Lecanicillium saksenae]